jgi:hypothetical protein
MGDCGLRIGGAENRINECFNLAWMCHRDKTCNEHRCRTDASAQHSKCDDPQKTTGDGANWLWHEGFLKDYLLPTEVILVLAQ